MKKKTKNEKKEKNNMNKSLNERYRRSSTQNGFINTKSNASYYAC